MTLDIEGVLGGALNTENGLRPWAAHTHFEIYLLARTHDPWLSIADDLVGVVAIVSIYGLITDFVGAIRHAESKGWNCM